MFRAWFMIDRKRLIALSTYIKISNIFHWHKIIRQKLTHHFTVNLIKLTSYYLHTKSTQFFVLHITIQSINQSNLMLEGIRRKPNIPKTTVVTVARTKQIPSEYSNSFESKRVHFYTYLVLYFRMSSLKWLLKCVCLIFHRVPELTRGWNNTWNIQTDVSHFVSHPFCCIIYAQVRNFGLYKCPIVWAIWSNRRKILWNYARLLVKRVVL